MKHTITYFLYSFLLTLSFTGYGQNYWQEGQKISAQDFLIKFCHGNESQQQQIIYLFEDKLESIGERPRKSGLYSGAKAFTYNSLILVRQSVNQEKLANKGDIDDAAILRIVNDHMIEGKYLTFEMGVDVDEYLAKIFNQIDHPAPQIIVPKVELPIVVYEPPKLILNIIPRVEIKKIPPPPTKLERLQKENFPTGSKCVFSSLIEMSCNEIKIDKMTNEKKEFANCINKLSQFCYQMKGNNRQFAKYLCKKEIQELNVSFAYVAEYYSINEDKLNSFFEHVIPTGALGNDYDRLIYFTGGDFYELDYERGTKGYDYYISPNAAKNRKIITDEKTLNYFNNTLKSQVKYCHGFINEYYCNAKNPLAPLDRKCGESQKWINVQTSCKGQFGEDSNFEDWMATH